jgi:hypothetical protein
MASRRIGSVTAAVAISDRISPSWSIVVPSDPAESGGPVNTGSANKRQYSNSINPAQKMTAASKIPPSQRDAYILPAERK